MAADRPPIPPSRTRAALGTLVGSSAASLVTVAQALLLIPLCLQKLDRDLYGAWLGTGELLVWLQLFDLGIGNLITQRTAAAHGRGGAREAGEWLGSGMLALGAIGAVLLVAVASGAGWLAEQLGISGADGETLAGCLRLGAAGSALVLLSNAFVGFARGVQRTALVNLASVGGSILSLLVAIGLLWAGWGLWALAWAIVVRGVAGLAGGAVLFAGLRHELALSLAPSRPALSELIGLTPTMAAGNLGYLLGSHSEVFLVLAILGPLPAMAYSLTRKAAEALKALLDSVTFAVYGGFAHLVVSPERGRARPLLGDIVSVRLAVACLGAACYAALNRDFVLLLFGREAWGGLALTLAFAVQLVVAGQSFLWNVLYRAAGAVREGSHLLLGEAAARVLLAAAAIPVLGLVGPPVAGTVVALAWAGVNARRLRRLLPDPAPAAEAQPVVRRLLGPALLLGGGLVACIGRTPSWPLFAGLAVALLATGGAAVFLTSPPWVRGLLGVSRA